MEIGSAGGGAAALSEFLFLCFARSPCFVSVCKSVRMATVTNTPCDSAPSTRKDGLVGRPARRLSRLRASLRSGEW